MARGCRRRRRVAKRDVISGIKVFYTLTTDNEMVHLPSFGAS